MAMPTKQYINLKIITLTNLNTILIPSIFITLILTLTIFITYVM